MNVGTINLVFAILWMAVTGTFSLPNFVLGFVFGALALYLIREQTGSDGYFARWRRIGALVRLFLYELAMSAWRVATMVLRRDMDLKPGIFSYETALTRDAEITLLANLITLTPGTLSVDVSDDKRTLYIHAVDCRDIEATRADIRNGFEKRIREAFA
ncbi:MAG: Na+/H+ antiporter subunit E [Rhizobiaceae bacterium]|jgi:multicomponent Na+:H+ antiporter subunit E|nr:Na+/H+ antiporter subunit E [Rhizobiaceae bacterium]